jgi:hypothetical protein
MVWILRLLIILAASRRVIAVTVPGRAAFIFNGTGVMEG